jgi:hypothetical protein
MRKPLTKEKLEKFVGREQEVVKISTLRRDGGTQPRASMDAETVEDYATRMQKRSDGVVVDLDGEPWREIVVFFDGTERWLADGFHRAAAAESAGIREMQADIRQGTRRDAFVFSLGANAKHGLRRTRQDKRRAVRQALWDEDLKKLSDTQVAKICGVSQPFVSKIRRELAKSDSYVPPSVRVGADGKEYATEKVTGRAPQNDSDVDGGKVIRRTSKGERETIAGGGLSSEVKTDRGTLRWVEGTIDRQEIEGVDIVFTQEAPEPVLNWKLSVAPAAKLLGSDGVMIAMHPLDDVPDVCGSMSSFTLVWSAVIRWLGGDGPELTQATVWARSPRRARELAGSIPKHRFFELSRDFGGRQFFARHLLEHFAEPGQTLVDPQAGAHVAPIAISAAAMGLDVHAIESNRSRLKNAKRMADNIL